MGTVFERWTVGTLLLSPYEAGYIILLRNHEASDAGGKISTSSRGGGRGRGKINVAQPAPALPATDAASFRIPVPLRHHERPVHHLKLCSSEEVLAAHRAPRLAPIFEGPEAASVEDMVQGR